MCVFRREESQVLVNSINDYVSDVKKYGNYVVREMRFLEIRGRVVDGKDSKDVKDQYEFLEKFLVWRKLK